MICSIPYLEQVSHTGKFGAISWLALAADHKGHGKVEVDLGLWKLFSILGHIGKPEFLERDRYGPLDGPGLWSWQRSMEP